MDNFTQLINALKELKEIDGIMLGGSRATGKNDKDSDYDVYVYLNEELEESKRREIISPYVKYMEYSNEFWELEDDGILSDGIDIEFIYRKINDIDSMLNCIVIEHQAWTGYTTCFWDNLILSKILYDPKGKLQALKDKYNIPYPKELKENIITKNFMLLKDKMPSFYYQIEKAVKRQDKISVNHRLTELLASYFDIIFAINEKTHPGEKRLLEATQDLNHLPKDYKQHLDILFTTMYTDQGEFTNTLDDMILNLYDLIKESDIEVSYNSYRLKSK